MRDGDSFRQKNLPGSRGEEDPARLIDAASGWFDQGCGDLQSVHNYFFRLKVHPEKERAAVLSEIGGHTYREPGTQRLRRTVWLRCVQGIRNPSRESYRELTEKVQKLIPQGAVCQCIYSVDGHRGGDQRGCTPGTEK